MQRVVELLETQVQEDQRVAEMLRSRIYRDADVEEARQAGLAYVEAWKERLAAVQGCLRRGEQWSAEEEKELKARVEAVEKAGQAYQELLVEK